MITRSLHARNAPDGGVAPRSLKVFAHLGLCVVGFSPPPRVGGDFESPRCRGRPARRWRHVVRRMCDFLKLMILSAVQGLAEFLPVSSSAHLVLVQKALSVESPGSSLELYLHAGTLATVCVFYRRRIAQVVSDMARMRARGWRFALCVVLSAVPAGIVYALCGERFESVYDSTRCVAALMVVNGALLLGASALVRSPGGGDVSVWRALAMGLGQAFAILPGISRSGTSISAGRVAGMGAAKAAEFSFLMSVPAIAGAILVDVASSSSGAEAEAASQFGGASFAAAAVVAAVVGYGALSLVVRTLERGRFWIFGVYCVAAGAVALAVLH